LAAYDDGWQAPPIPAVGDASWAETSLYDVALTAPDGMEVVSTGTVVDRRRIGDSMRWHILTGPVREFAAAISADFERHGADVGDARLNYYILPHPNSATPPDVALSLAGKALDVYEDRFGPYPYADSTWRS
jgi:hypothetical protein